MELDNFFIYPPAVRDLAQQFQAAADRIASMTPAFEGNVLEVGEAFGVLGACTDTTSGYLTLVHNTVHGLGQLEQALDADQAGLTDSVDQYVAVDQHNSRLLWGN